MNQQIPPWWNEPEDMPGDSADHAAAQQAYDTVVALFPEEGMKLAAVVPGIVEALAEAVVRLATRPDDAGVRVISAGKATSGTKLLQDMLKRHIEYLLAQAIRDGKPIAFHGLRLDKYHRG